MRTVVTVVTAATIILAALATPSLGHGGVYRGPHGEVPPNVRLADAVPPPPGLRGSNGAAVDARCLRDLRLSAAEERGTDAARPFVALRPDRGPTDCALLARLDAAAEAADRREALVALGLSATPAPSVLDRLEAILARGENEERKLAALALGLIGGRAIDPAPRIARALRARLDAGKEYRFDAYVILAMGLSGDAAHLDALEPTIDDVCSSATSRTNMLASNAIVAMTRLVERHPTLAGRVRANLARGLASGCGETRRAATIAIGRIGSLPELADDERRAFARMADELVDDDRIDLSRLALFALGRIGSASPSAAERARIGERLDAVFLDAPEDDSARRLHAALALGSLLRIDAATRVEARDHLHARFAREDTPAAEKAVLAIALALAGDRRIEGPIHAWIADGKADAVLPEHGRIALRILSGESGARRSTGGVALARLVRDASYVNPMATLDEVRRAIGSE